MNHVGLGEKEVQVRVKALEIIVEELIGSCPDMVSKQKTERSTQIKTIAAPRNDASFPQLHSARTLAQVNADIARHSIHSTNIVFLC